MERELGNEGHVVEEEEDDIEDISFVQQTYDDLKAVYNQITPDESDADHTDEDYIKVVLIWVTIQKRYCLNK